MARISDPGLAAAWQEVVDRFRRSGLSQREFCQDEGLSTSTLSYWLRKLASRPAPAELDKAQFIRLIDASPSGGTEFSLVVELPGGVVLRYSGLHQ